MVKYSKRNKHNIDTILKDSAQITIDTISKFDIKYDELIFGKPNTDIYINDMPYFKL